MAIAGIIGFILVACKFNAAALILGLVLGNLCETNLRRAVTIANGDTMPAKVMYLLNRPITGVIMLACIVMLLYPVIKDMLANKKKAKPSV
jgi:putative tricarboxylic transport membrane protein